MQNIDKIRQIHNEGVIKMQIACLLVLPWRTARDPRARSEPQPPPSPALAARGERDGAGGKGRAGLPRTARWAPTSRGPPEGHGDSGELLGARSSLGEQPERETFDELVKLDIKIHQRHHSEI